VYMVRSPSGGARPPRSNARSSAPTARRIRVESRAPRPASR